MSTVATDGGKHYEEIADETDYSIRQVYRAIEEVGDLVVNDNGLVKMFSEKIRQQIQGLAETLEDQVMSTANRLAHLCNVETRSAADSALQKWMNKYGVEFEGLDDDGNGRIRIDTVLSTIKSGPHPNLDEVLSEGKDAWIQTGRDITQFAELRYIAKEIVGAGDAGRVASALR